jgi:hypothetical protein
MTEGFDLYSYQYRAELRASTIRIINRYKYLRKQRATKKPALEKMGRFFQFLLNCLITCNWYAVLNKKIPVYSTELLGCMKKVN